jgi:methylated-DNA-[protein]-cysteine S-methyltransferase
MNTPLIHTLRIDSPVGPLQLAASDVGLHAIEFEHARHPLRRDAGWVQAPHPLLSEAARQLDAYFACERREFSLPLAAQGTDFQHSVWRALAEIPYAATCSYTQIAIRLGRPTATRAVGAANGRNPLPIVVPCHRVIGADGALTGFGGGLPLKAWLLTHEQSR